MQAMIIRVGIDKGYGETLGPIFADGSFEFVPIPEYYAGTHSIATYHDQQGRSGLPLSTYVPAKLKNTPMHDDPEFDTFTYGDPTPKRRYLVKLQASDLLVFYAGLQPYETTSYETALYVIGYFTVSEVVDFNKLSDEQCIAAYERFANNAHVKRRDDYNDMLIVVGDKGRSRLLDKAIRISQLKSDKRGRPLHVVSEDMEKLMGISGSIQRSPPRWIIGHVHINNLVKLLEDST